jgi:predicted Zn-ribbon and HTH transcriptional regulator
LGARRVPRRSPSRALIAGNIRRELNARGMPTCVRCGYWLRELPESVDRCPECGSQVG